MITTVFLILGISFSANHSVAKTHFAEQQILEVVSLPQLDRHRYQLTVYEPTTFSNSYYVLAKRRLTWRRWLVSKVEDLLGPRLFFWLFFLPVAILVGFLVVAVCATYWVEGRHQRKLSFGDTERTYLWYQSKSRNQKMPLVLVYHRGAARRIRQSSQLHKMVSTHGFHLAYIKADPKWFFFEREDVDGNAGVLMFDMLKEDLTANNMIDTNRIYVVGMSGGGDFVIHLAMHRSAVIAAVVAQSSCMLDNQYAIRSIPMMFIAGTCDSEVSAEDIETNTDIYRDRGHEIVYLRPNDVSDRWEKSLDNEAWEFLSKHSLEA